MLDDHAATADPVTIHHGDCRDVLPTLAAESVDAVVCDPPYELGFMGRAWDASGVAFDPAVWRECLRVLKPGGHLVAFGGTRTWHRLAVAVEDAGAEMRDSLAWLYGSGFPKSHDVSKAIDKAAGVEREVIGVAADFARDGATRRADGSHVPPHGQQGEHRFRDRWSTPVTAPATDAAAQWAGWGTALKPAWEPIVFARKPLAGTVAANVLQHGTGALNIDACRVAGGERPKMTRTSTITAASSMAGTSTGSTASGETTALGRWPANVVLAHGELCTDGQCELGCPVAELDAQSGTTKSSPTARCNRVSIGGNGAYGGGGDVVTTGHADAGGASRFFPVFRYQAKAPSRERPRVDGVAHPTVKPLELMRWIARLVCRPGGVILDPFLGSGTTAQAAVLEGMRCVGIERDETYLALIRARLAG